MSGNGIPVNLFRLSLLLAILAVSAAAAGQEIRLRDGGAANSAGLVGTQDEDNNSRVYIVQLKTPSAAAIHARMMPTLTGRYSPGTALRTARLDRKSALIQSHVQMLDAEQSRVIARVGSAIDPIYNYRYSLNGFAARMTPLQASKIENMPDVLHVWEDEVRPLATNFSADFLGLFEPDVGLRGAPGLDGDGIVIGVIDSGVAPDHPALQDTREADRPRLCQSAWAEVSLLGIWLCRRYDQMEDIQVFEPPENWNGTCQSGPQFAATDCNNKLIGARYFIDGARATGPIDSGEIISPLDVDGHGTHTATTAAGNRVRASIFGTVLGRVEGIAPKARVAVYKACWLRPGATRSSCNTSDLANAIDMAVADGVDIINYSVGSSLFTVTAPDDVALLAAAKAGVLAVVAAGNEGPNFDTITSPASNPAVLTTAASSRDGEHALEALQVRTPAAIAGKYPVREANFTPALSERGPLDAALVLVDDDDDTLPDGTDGATFDACQPIVNGSELSGKIAFIQRGGCDFDIKVENADDAGAIAVLVFNISGDPIVMNGDAGQSDIPALMVGAADGNLILDEINAGESVSAVLDKSLFLTVADTGNILGTFSSRGPGVVPDIAKPDVTAPGINILAGSSPHIANGIADEFFAYLSGTSMSAPHVSGVAALLKQSHPDWSPAAIKSALMTTAYQEINHSDSESAAIPFDFGSGHIDPNKANDPGLIYDISDDGYDAFSCAAASPGIEQARCDELSASGISFEPSDMNQASISVSKLTSTRTVARQVTNVTDSAETYNAEIVAPPGIGVQVTPATLTVGPGQSADFDVTLNYESGPLDFYRFGSLTWVSNEHTVRSVISVRPLSLTAPGDLITFGGSGSITFPVSFGYNGTYRPGVHGLHPPSFDPDLYDVFIPEDTSKTFTRRNVNGVHEFVFDVPDNQLFLRFALFDALTDGDDDLDMFVYYCPPELDCTLLSSYTKIGESGGATSREEVDVLLPPAGSYAVYIHAFETDNVAGESGAIYTLLAWQLGLVDDAGNMTATGPGMVSAGTTEDVTVSWSGLPAGTIYLGGISHNTPDELVGLTVISVEH
jgi:subtilisin family serine protease